MLSGTLSLREAIVNGRTRVITVGVFGTLVVRVGDRVLGPRDLGGVKSRRLLELLLLNDRAVTKDELIEELWGGKMPRDPIATLEACVSVLRSSLQPGVHRDDSLIATEPGAYRLVRERADIDVDRFDALVRSLPGTEGAERRTLLMEACSLAVAPILADERYVEWTEGARRHYERLRLEIHVAAAEAFLAAGVVGTSLDLAERAVAIDRSCEPAYHVAMRAAAELGRRDMVLRFFQQCERSVRLELDSTPLAATIALRDQLLDQRRLVGAASSGNWSPAIEHASVDVVWPLSRFR